MRYVDWKENWLDTCLGSRLLRLHVTETWSVTLCRAAWERVGPFLAPSARRSITRAPSTLTASPSYSFRKQVPSLADSAAERISRSLWNPSHGWGAELHSVPLHHVCDSQRHSAGVSSLKKKALVHQIQSCRVRVNLLPLKITIYQDNPPSSPPANTPSSSSTS